MRYSVPVAYFLWLISGCGALGFQRFYLGKTGTGLLWLVSGGLGMIGAIYDFFTLPRQVMEANMRDEYRTNLELERRGYLPRRAEYAAKPESIEKTVLRTARKNGGAVTPGEVALEGECTVDEAKKALDKLAGSGHCEMRVRASGVVVYVFPEFVREGQDDFVV
jgi:TM2 domain-containing membrane protein YozV